MMKETKNVKHNQCDDLELKNVVNMMKNLFSDLSINAGISSLLLDKDIHDSFSQAIGKALQNPLQSSFEALANIEQTIMDLIHSSVLKIFEDNKDAIKSVHKLNNSGSIMHYSVLLHDDKLCNQRFIFRFLTDYNKSAYANRFPIIIQVIPNDIENDFNEEVSNDKFTKII